MSVRDALDAAAAMSGNRPRPTGTDRQTPYFDAASVAFIQARGRLAPNVYAADIERAAFDETYFSVNCRVADVISANTPTARRPDEHKTLKPLEPVGYLHVGTKVRFNTFKASGKKDIWLVVSPENMVSDISVAQIRKCNRKWNRQDYYGKRLSEPFVLDDIRGGVGDANQSAAAVDLTTQRDAYDCLMQLNKRTRGLKNEDRIVLGGTAYAVRGLNGHSLEFTEDPDSARLLYFTLYRVNASANDSDDIADEKLTRWEIKLSAERLTVMQNASGEIKAGALRNGVPPEKPYGLTWESADESVLTVDYSGDGSVCVYTAHGVGETLIRCRLRENPEVYAEVVVAVDTYAADDFAIAFVPAPPETLKQQESVLVSCFVSNNGVTQPIPVRFDFSGAGAGFYAVTALTDNGVTIRCVKPSVNRLAVTAEAITPVGTLHVTHEITLEGM